MEEKIIKGTALYCGIGVTLEQMEEHLDKAQKAGINALFTSLQMPEINKDELFSDFPIMCKMAHDRGMRIAADIGPTTAEKFGIDLKDLRSIKDFGIDILRLDCGYTKDETIELTHNNVGLEIQLNAATATEALVKYFSDNGINKENMHWCHNFYPMRYTGLRVEQVKKYNEVIHSYGFKVAGFVPSKAHPRIGVSLGLPTLERHRTMDLFAAVQESYLVGMDYIYFGDDLASEEELNILGRAMPGAVHFRMKPLVDAPEVMEWLDGRSLRVGQCGLEHIIRTPWTYNDCKYPGYDGGLVQPIKRGDVSIAKTPLLRYAGEVQIARVDLPADENIGVIGHIIDEDIPLLDTFNVEWYKRDWTPFCIDIVK